MKNLFLGAAAFVLTGGLMAQENRASVGLELAFPMGDFGDFAGMGIGGTLGYELPIGDNLGLFANLGYMSFMAKDIDVAGVTVEGSSMSAIPLQIGAKYYFTDNQEGAYLGLLTGVHILTSSAEGAESTTDFGVAPLLGFMIGENIDLGLRYQMLFDKTEVITYGSNGLPTGTAEESQTFSYLGLRVAYMFGER